MKWLRQKHKLGCATASLAMIAGITYDEALALVHPDRKKGSKVATNMPRIKDVILSLDFNIEVHLNPMMGEVIFQSYSDNGSIVESRGQMLLVDEQWLDYPKSPAILTVWMEPYIPWRHAVVWDGERILDPMIESAYPVESYFKNLVSAIIVRKI